MSVLSCSSMRERVSIFWWARWNSAAAAEFSRPPPPPAVGLLFPFCGSEAMGPDSFPVPAAYAAGLTRCAHESDQTHANAHTSTRADSRAKSELDMNDLSAASPWPRQAR